MQENGPASRPWCQEKLDGTGVVPDLPAGRAEHLVEKGNGAFEDVAACASSVVDAGIAEPGRLGILGRSYGGYLTLATLTRFPELFKVGVAICGMSINRFTAACCAYRRAASAIFTARSPTRSKSVLIFTAATIVRRSAAMG